MNIEEKRKEIIKEHFSTKKLVITILLLIIGILLVYIFINRIINLTYNDSDEESVLLIVGGSCIIISIYILNDYFYNIVLKPKKEVMYLDIKNDYKCVYVNKKGHRFVYEEEDGKEEGKYYIVLRTKNYIYDVLDEVSNNDNWAIKVLEEKEEDEEDKKITLITDVLILLFTTTMIIPIIYVATKKTPIATSDWYIPLICLASSTATVLSYFVTKVINSLLKKIGINIKNTSISGITAMIMSIIILYIFGKVILKLNI